MKYFLAIWIIILLCISCSGDEQLMVCKPVNSVFETSQTNSTNHGCSSSSTGRPGKQGARGLRGPPGPAGPPGVVDYDQLNLRLQTEIDQIKRKLLCIDGVLVGNTCYKLIYRVGVRMNYEQARSLCAFHGGGLAEIPTEEVYNAIYGYVKANWYIDVDHHDVTFIHCWLGSSYDGNRNVILTSGRRGYAKWYPGHPVNGAGRTRTGIRVHIKPEDPNHGMYTDPPTNILATPLCQFQLE